MDIKNTILKYALQNAVKFSGKANPGAVIGKIFAENPELKAQAKEIGKKVAEIVKKVNSITLKEQKEELEATAPELLEEKKEKKKKGLPPLKNAKKGEVVTRIPPEPSKYLHIGHALSFIINYLYAKKYDGRCIVRYEDTNPEKAEKEYYDSIAEDIKWLKIKPNKNVIVSNDMPKFYKYAEELIRKGDAYVCFCSRETMSDYRAKGMICSCREKHPAQNMEEWQNMLKGKYKEGECVLRLKGIMDDPNMAMRDPVLFRIIYAKHPVQGKKYSVWPMYDFENVVEDELCGITHIMRSNEFGAMRIELQNYLKLLLKFRRQEVVQYGRFNIVGAITQGREIRKLIEEKKVIGWDDPRLVTIKALRRRGIQPEALYELAQEAGMSTSQTNIDWTVLAAINRKIIDPVANRYFFVKDPVRIKIKNAPKITARLALHPDKKSGVRVLHTDSKFYISDKLKKGVNYRLMHLFNFKNNTFISEEYDENLRAKIIHWVPVKEAVKVDVLMPDGVWAKGVGEKSLLKVKEGEVVQFERFGFVRLDQKLKTKLKFWYTHD